MTIKNLLFLLFLLSSITIYSEEYSVGSPGQIDSVIFKSTAKLEFIQGESNEIEGYFNFTNNNPAELVSGKLRVDLTKLKSSIEKRDEHMRERHLHTDKFPYAYFELTGVDKMPAMVTGDSLYEVTGSGYFYIHGVKRVLKPSLVFVYDEAENEVKIHAFFQINLDEYKIPRPKALFLKLAETIEVEIVFTGHKSKPAPRLQLPDWPEIN